MTDSYAQLAANASSPTPALMLYWMVATCFGSLAQSATGFGLAIILMFAWQVQSVIGEFTGVLGGGISYPELFVTGTLANFPNVLYVTNTILQRSWREAGERVAEDYPKGGGVDQEGDLSPSTDGGEPPEIDIVVRRPSMKGRWLCQMRELDHPTGLSWPLFAFGILLLNPVSLLCIQLMLVMDPSVLKTFLGWFCIFFAAYYFGRQLWAWRGSRSRDAKQDLPPLLSKFSRRAQYVGWALAFIVAGVCAGFFTIPGPPLMMYLAISNVVGPAQLRNTQFVYSVAMIVRVPMLASLVPWEKRMVFLPMCTASLLLGGYLGNKLHHSVPGKILMNSVVWLLLASAVGMVFDLQKGNWLSMIGLALVGGSVTGALATILFPVAGKLKARGGKGTTRELVADEEP